MKLTTELGVMDLPEDLSFEVDRWSTFFSAEGEQSLPVTLPATQRNLALLHRPLRMKDRRQPVMSIAAVLQHGVFQRSGRLVISGASRDGITASLALGESGIYEKYSDRPIRELFSGTVREDWHTVEEWMEYIGRVNSGEVEDDFTVMPVLVEKDDDRYLVLNEPADGDTSRPQKIVSGCRTLTVGGSVEQVPEGYGVTPFLRLRRFVQLLFEKMECRIVRNAIDEIAFFDNIVLLNACADTLCTPRLHYDDLVPSCTVGEFLEFLEKRFNIFCFSTEEGVQLLLMDLDLEEKADLDLSLRVDRGQPVTVSYAARKHLVLSSDTSLEGAAPPEETLMMFRDKYPVVAVLDEERFRSLHQYSVVLRTSTGTYYLVKRVLEKNTAEAEAIGTNYFARDRRNSESPEELSAADLLPPMVRYARNGAGDVIVAPYIGNRIHRHTSYTSEREDGEQPIVLAIDAGMAAGSPDGPAYRLATTQRYDDRGILFQDHDLTPESVFDLLFAARNRVLLNCLSSVTMTLHLTVRELLSFTMGPKWYDGVRLIPKRLSYVVGQSVEAGESEFLIVKRYANKVEDAAVTFEDQRFTWVFRSRVIEECEELEKVHDIVEYSWIDSLATEAVYIPPPSRDGETGYRFGRPARFRCTNKFGTDEVIIEKEVDSWFESVPIAG